MDRLRLLVGLDWLLTVDCDVLSLSVGPRGRFDETDPLQIATKAFVDHGRVVVVAAGNYGPALESLQAMARAPWVISVAAVNDTLEPVHSSSRGGAFLAGPSVASYGANPYHAGEITTSFAAPRVAHAAAFTRKSLELLVADLQAQSEGEPGQWSSPIAFPWIGIADTGWDPEKAPYQWGPISSSLLPEKSMIEIESTQSQQEWASTFLDATGSELIPTVTPAMVRRALEMSARPIASDPTAVGRGLVTIDTAMSFFRNLTPSRVGAVMGLDHRQSLLGLDHELGLYWGPDRTGVTEDAFGTGIRLSVARVAR